MGRCRPLERQGLVGAPAHLACQPERLVAWGGVGWEVEAQALRRGPRGWIHVAAAWGHKCTMWGVGNGVVGTQGACTPSG